MRLFILILILWSANSFFEYQMRHIDNLNPAQQYEYAQKINLANELNTYERSF
jgi:hypothetical protein